MNACCSLRTLAIADVARATQGSERSSPTTDCLLSRRRCLSLRDGWGKPMTAAPLSVLLLSRLELYLDDRHRHRSALRAHLD